MHHDDHHLEHDHHDDDQHLEHDHQHDDPGDNHDMDDDNDHTDSGDARGVADEHHNGPDDYAAVRAANLRAAYIDACARYDIANGNDAYNAYRAKLASARALLAVVDR